MALGSDELPQNDDTIEDHGDRSIAGSKANSDPPLSDKTKEPEPKAPDDGEEPAISYADTIEIWRLIIILACLGFSLFLSSLETSIVATSLVSISANLGYFGSANWIVVTYFLTYTGFMIIYARLSDVYGRKSLILVAIAIFGLFSLGCGLAADMTTLIILRAFQGMGGSGIYAMVFAVAPEIVPLKYFGVFTGLGGAVYVCSSILGPILGGIISSSSSWRWIFLLNVPPCAIIFVSILLFYPRNAPRIAETRSLKQVDGIGLFLALGASILLVFPLEEAENAYPWSSGAIIGTMAASAACWFLFVIWEMLLSRTGILQKNVLPAFPLRLFRNRVLAAAYTTGFLAGGPFTATLILLPQRYQILNALDPFHAGIRMLPLLLSSAVGSMLGGLGPKIRHGAYGLLVFCQGLVVVGFGLLSTITDDSNVPPVEYGSLILMGVGFGGSLSTLLVLSRTAVSPHDSAILMASLTQVRVLGGCIGLAISNALVTSQTSSVSRLVSSSSSNGGYDPANLIASLPVPLQTLVRDTFMNGFILQTRVMLGLAALAWVAGLFTWDANPRNWMDVKAEQASWEKEMKAKQVANTA